MIKIAILVNKAVEEVNTIPMLGLINGIVEVLVADPDPAKISVTINNIFFYLMICIPFYKFVINFKFK